MPSLRAARPAPLARPVRSQLPPQWGLAVSRWWEAKITCHIEAETHEEADEVVSVLFDQDAVQGGSWRSTEITNEDDEVG